MVLEQMPTDLIKIEGKNFEVDNNGYMLVNEISYPLMERQIPCASCNIKSIPNYKNQSDGFSFTSLDKDNLILKVNKYVIEEFVTRMKYLVGGDIHENLE